MDEIKGDTKILEMKRVPKTPHARVVKSRLLHGDEDWPNATLMRTKAKLSINSARSVC